MERHIIFASVILLSCLTQGQSQGWAEDACDRISNVEIRYKPYYDVYLDFNVTKQSPSGFFYEYIKVAVNECCHFMNVSFKKLEPTELEVEDLALKALGENEDVIPRPLVFYFPEFTANQAERFVYDYDLNFVKLARSPGQAVVMFKPESKEQVSLIYIFRESTPMLAMMLTMSWFVGILGWIAVSTISYHTTPYHTTPYHTTPYHTYHSTSGRILSMCSYAGPLEKPRRIPESIYFWDV
jgi:hypothetical protein